MSGVVTYLAATAAGIAGYAAAAIKAATNSRQYVEIVDAGWCLAHNFPKFRYVDGCQRGMSSGEQCDVVAVYVESGQ